MAGTNASEELGRRVEKAAKHARDTMKRAALETVGYLAAGEMLKADLMKMFGVTPEMAEVLLRANATNLIEGMRKV